MPAQKSDVCDFVRLNLQSNNHCDLSAMSTVRGTKSNSLPPNTEIEGDKESESNRDR